MNAPVEPALRMTSTKLNERVILLGLDFGSTTSSALLVSAKLASVATGRMQLDDVQIVYKSEPVFTPFHDNNIDTDKISHLITIWLQQSGVTPDTLFSGGGMVTGLAARAENASALAEIITDKVGDRLIATADDPCLESWLAFMGSCGAISRYYAAATILNFDIGGGTTNVALGTHGDVQATGCYFIGARHFQFVAGTYQLTAISSFGVALLAELDIQKTIGETLNVLEREKIIAFYIHALEAIILGESDFFKSDIAQKHTQIALDFPTKSNPYITFSGGVGELIYKIIAGEVTPSTTFFGDFGVDLALAIIHSPLLSAHLKTIMPENQGRATVMGLTLYSTEISGHTVYLPQPDWLPLRNLPIVAKLALESSAEQWRSAFALAAKCNQGACLQLVNLNEKPTLACIRALAEKIKHSIITSQFNANLPLLILLEANIGKALGNYISNWGQNMQQLIVIDEIPTRDAQFVHVGSLHQQIIPVSFFGLN